MTDNLDTMEEFSREVDDAEEAIRVEANNKFREDLKEYKPFKDLLMGKDNEWKAIKDHIGLYAFRLPMVGNETITADFISGIRFCLELIDERYKAFDNAYNQLGKGE